MKVTPKVCFGVKREVIESFHLRYLSFEEDEDSVLMLREFLFHRSDVLAVRSEFVKKYLRELSA